MKSLIKVTIALLVVVTGIANAAVVVTNDVSGDTYISNYHPDTNYGADNLLIVAAPGTGAGGDYRSLLSFNLPLIPNAVITSATLSLVNWNFGGNGVPMTQSIYTATSAWNEDTATWTNANGNYNPADLNVSSTIFTPTNNFVTYNFDVTAIVNSWYTNTTANNGFYILSEYTPGASFASYAASDLGYASPGLTINYSVVSEVPEPSTAALIVASGALLLVLRKRRGV
jgi:hypothetical protein